MANKEGSLWLSKSFLKSILEKSASPEAMDWLGQQMDKIEQDKGGMKLYLAFGQASKHFSKKNLELIDHEIQEADSLRKGFRIQCWNELQTARTLLLLSMVSEEDTFWLEKMDKIVETGDMHEQEALYAALPLLPFPERLTKRAAEGLRTNIISIFDAIALDNPYPSEYLEEKAWNQLLLKAIFMQRPLYRIIGADQRANPDLAKTLVDYVHERWSAGRSVMPELWRYVGPFLDEHSLPMLDKVLREGEKLEQQAVALVCFKNHTEGARELLENYPQLKSQVASGSLSWENVGKEYYDKQMA
ncbi:MAG: EboA domain-containing protein [Cyclobacteriaceae bacterium]